MKDETVSLERIVLKFHSHTHLASRARANTPAASGAAADVPLCVVVHLPYRSVVAWKKKKRTSVEKWQEESSLLRIYKIKIHFNHDFLPRWIYFHFNDVLIAINTSLEKRAEFVLGKRVSDFKWQNSERSFNSTVSLFIIKRFYLRGEKKKEREREVLTIA